MSAYIAIDDLQTAFGAAEILALTDRDDDGTPDPDIADDAINSACSEMDGYFVGGGYTVPLAPVTPVVKRIALNVARYYLYTDAAPDIVTQNYQAAVKWLKDVAAGAVRLGTDAAGAAPAIEGHETTIVAAPNPFARRCGA